MLDIRYQNNVYFKIYLDTGYFNPTNDFTIYVPYTGVLKYRVNGGAWTTVGGTGTNDKRFRVDHGNVEVVNRDNNSTIIGAQYDTIEVFMSYVQSITPLDDYLTFDDYKYLAKNSIVDAIELHLYNLTSEKHLVNKLTYLSNDTLLYGQFTEEVDILNPSIVLQYGNIFSFNYFYIPSLNRYYFINSIVSLRKDVWRVNGHVDVLYSYATDIRSQTGFVTRNESSMIHYLIDDRIPFEDVPTVEYKLITNLATGDINATFDFSDVTNGYKFVLHTQNSVTWIFTPTDIGSPDANLPEIPNLAHQNGSVYLLDSTAMANVYTGNRNNDNGASSIVSMLYIPVDLHTLYGFTSAPTTYIYSGDYVLDYDSGILTWCSLPHTSSGLEPVGYHIENSNTPYLVIADFNFNATPFTSTIYNTYGYWINATSKCHYELYIPFVGYVELNFKDLWNSRIQIMYSINFDSGMGLCIVFNKTLHKIIYSTQCQIGYQIPINTTNAHEITIQKQNNTTNLMLSLVGSVITIGIGGLAGGLATTASSAIMAGAGALVSGASKSSSAIANFINQNNLLFERASVNVGGEDGMFYLPVTSPHWKITYHKLVSTSNYTMFLNKNGHPYRKTSSLSSLTGYTEITDIHYTPTSQTYITSPEIDEIESLAQNGIIL